MKNSAAAGFVLMLVSALAYGLLDIFVKISGENLNPWQLTFGRAVMGMAATLAWGRFDVRRFFVADWPWQLAVGLASTCGFVTMMFAIKLLPLSVALPLVYLYPSLGALMSPLINGEKPTRRDWLAIGLAFAGIIFLTHGSSAGGAEALNWLGLLMALACAVFMGLMANLARRQGKSTDGQVVAFYLFFVNFAGCLPALILMDGPALPAGADALCLWGILAPLSTVAVIAMTLGFRRLSAHRGGVILTLEAVTASLFGLIILAEPLTFFVALGGSLLIASAAVIASAK